MYRLPAPGRSVREQVMSTVIPGGRAPVEVRSNQAEMDASIPPEFWADLKREGLLPADIPTP